MGIHAASPWFQKGAETGPEYLTDAPSSYQSYYRSHALILAAGMRKMKNLMGNVVVQSR